MAGHCRKFNTGVPLIGYLVRLIALQITIGQVARCKDTDNSLRTQFNSNRSSRADFGGALDPRFTMRLRKRRLGNAVGLAGASDVHEQLRFAKTGCLALAESNTRTHFVVAS